MHETTPSKKSRDIPTNISLDEQGGKARGLKVLQEMGYQVPEYFVVPFNRDINDPEIANRVTRERTLVIIQNSPTLRHIPHTRRETKQLT